MDCEPSAAEVTTANQLPRPHTQQLRCSATRWAQMQLRTAAIGEPAFL